MKKLLLITCVILVSCANKQHKMIENYIKGNIGDASSYESIVFGTLDSTFVGMSGTNEYIELEDSIQYYKELNENIKELMELEMSENSKYTAVEFQKFSKAIQDEKLKYSSLSLKYSFKQMDLSKQAIKMLETDTVVFNGFTLDHKYRVKNEDGNMVVVYCRFYFDPNLSEIVYAKEF